MVVVEAPQPRGLSGVEQHLEIARRHWVAVVGKATGVEPGHDALRVVNRGQRPSRLLRYHLLEKLGTEGAFEIEHVVAYTRQDDAEEGLHDIEGVGHTNPRIPLQECLRVAIDRAEEAVEAALEEVVFRQQESIGKMRHFFGLSVKALSAPPGSGSPLRGSFAHPSTELAVRSGRP